MGENGDTGSAVSRSSANYQERLATGLAMVAGFVDAYGIISYNTYLSFMSGNTTQTGYRAGQGDFALALPSALAIVFFAGGSFVGALMANSETSEPRRVAFSVVAASLALVVGLKQLGHLSDEVSHRVGLLGDGDSEYDAVPGRLNPGERNVCDRNVEQAWCAFGTGGQRCTPPG